MKLMIDLNIDDTQMTPSPADRSGARFGASVLSGRAQHIKQKKLKDVFVYMVYMLHQSYC